jgi:uncharacterized protein YbaR (Trm112 family)
MSLDDESPSFDRRMLEALICPQTGGVLSYDADRGELVSKAARCAYPIRNGIPIMLKDEARDLSQDAPKELQDI